MRRTGIVALRGTGAGLLAALLCLTHAAAAPEEAPEAKRARAVAQYLEADRVPEALVEARAAVKQFPANSLLHRRLAQTKLAQTMQVTVQLAHAAEAAGFGRALQRGVELLKAPASVERQAKLGYADKYADFLKVLERAEVRRFPEDAQRQFEQGAATMDQGSRALSEARAELAEAARLGDATTERELTELWSATIALLWLRDVKQFRELPATAGATPAPPSGKDGANVPPGDAGALDRALLPLRGITPESVLVSAAGLAQRRSSDAAALAGAADVISVVDLIGGQPRPLRQYARQTIDRPYRSAKPSAEGGVPGLSAKAAREMYLQARAAKDPDVRANPEAAAIQLYEQSLKLDKDGALQSLRVRVYLQRLPFDAEGARSLLDDLARREPRNAVVALERARAALLLDGKLPEGLTQCRAATRQTEFARVFPVAAPAPLQRALSRLLGRKGMTRDLWPGYAWLFSSLSELQGEQGEASQRMEFRRLRLSLAERLCKSSDYYDQAVGIDEKTRVLAELLALGDQLPAGQRVQLQAELQQHRKEFAAFPRSVSILTLTTDGFKLNEFPRLNTGRMRGYMLDMLPSGFAGFGYGTGIY